MTAVFEYVDKYTEESKPGRGENGNELPVEMNITIRPYMSRGKNIASFESKLSFICSGIITTFVY